MEKFKVLRLNENLLRVLQEEGFTEPTEVQEKAIPLALEGKDILASSATGSGKTLAYGASIIETSVKGKGVQALILTPTRELAEQVSQNLRKFSKLHRLTVTEVYGGVALGPQIQRIQRSEIIVGTPGRILDHLNRRSLDISRIRTLVLDEADRMLDMGFIDDLKRIIERCPKHRQTMLFSATISRDIERIANNYMNNPIRIDINNQVDPSKLRQVYYDVPQQIKFSLLVNFLRNEQTNLVMVFCNTKRNVDFLAENLKMHNIDALAIHGGFSQNKRSETMIRFHSGKAKVLICTDVAARGLDIKNVSHVYSYDIPKTSTDYIHRIGRTARAGKDGIAVSLLCSRDYDNFQRVKSDRSLNITREDAPKVEILQINPQKREFGRNFRDRNSGRGFQHGHRWNH